MTIHLPPCRSLRRFRPSGSGPIPVGLKETGANVVTLACARGFLPQLPQQPRVGGLMPIPWAGGDVRLDQGIGHGGPLGSTPCWYRWSGAGSASGLAARSASGSKPTPPVPGADPQRHDRGTGPQAPGRPVVLCLNRPRADRLTRRLGNGAWFRDPGAVLLPLRYVSIRAAERVAARRD